MALNVISNFAANIANRQLARSDMEMTDSLAKLSSGTRVLSAKDDAASMAIGSRLKAEINALRQAQVNAGQAVSMLQVADGAMARSNDILLRMKTLAVQAGSGQISDTERAMLDTEYQQLLSEVDRLALDTEFNGNTLVNGAYAVARQANASDFEIADGIQDIVFKGSHTIATGTGTQVTLSYNSTNGFSITNGATTYSAALSSTTNDGTNMTTGAVVSLTSSVSTDTATIDIVLSTAFLVNASHQSGNLNVSGSNSQAFSYKVGTGNSTTADQITVTLTSVSLAALGLTTSDVRTVAQADQASSLISSAVDTLNTARADIGASQNRLEFAAANIATTLENMEAARSNLLDLDIAAEMSRLTSKQILVQAGVAMLAQANQTPQALLRLFQ